MRTCRDASQASLGHEDGAELASSSNEVVLPGCPGPSNDPQCVTASQNCPQNMASHLVPRPGKAHDVAYQDTSLAARSKLLACHKPPPIDSLLMGDIIKPTASTYQGSVSHHLRPQDSLQQLLQGALCLKTFLMQSIRHITKLKVRDGQPANHQRSAASVAQMGVDMLYICRIYIRLNRGRHGNNHLNRCLGIMACLQVKYSPLADTGSPCALHLDSTRRSNAGMACSDPAEAVCALAPSRLWREMQ